MIFWFMFNAIWFREFCGWLSYCRRNSSVFANNVAEKQSNVGIRRHYSWNDHANTFDKDGWCRVSNISFLFLVQKKTLVVNMGEKWNLLCIIVNIGKSKQYCVNENIYDSLFIRWDKRKRVLSDIFKPRLPPSFWCWRDFKRDVCRVS